MIGILSILHVYYDRDNKYIVQISSEISETLDSTNLFIIYYFMKLFTLSLIVSKL